MLNDAIELIGNNGLQDEVYNIFAFIGYLSALLFVVWYGKKLKEPIKRVLFSSLISIICTIAIMLFVMWAENGFYNFGRKNIIVTYAYVPIVGYIISKLFKCTWKSMWDYQICIPLMEDFIGGWGCVFFGCCYGFPCEWGIYNIRKEACLFPIQIIESVTAFLIWCFIIIRSKRNHYGSDGMNVPIVLILYGMLIIIFEYFHDNNKLIIGWSSISFHAVFMIIVGIISLLIIYKSRKEKFKERKKGGTLC